MSEDWGRSLERNRCEGFEFGALSGSHDVWSRILANPEGNLHESNNMWLITKVDEAVDSLGAISGIRPVFARIRVQNS